MDSLNRSDRPNKQRMGNDQLGGEHGVAEELKARSAGRGERRDGVTGAERSGAPVEGPSHLLWAG